MPAFVAPDALTSLPTLLTSRPKERPRPKPVCLATEPPPLPRTPPEQYPMYIPVRNTFIETGAERSPSLERFYQEREVSTCPSGKIGLLKGLFQEDKEEPIGSLHEARSLIGAEARAGSAAAPNDLPAVVLPLAAVLHEAPAVAPAALAPSVLAPPALTAPVKKAYTVPEEAAQAPWPAMGDLLLGGKSELQSEAKDECGAVAGPGELPSIGSVGHTSGRCKPCAFFHTVGCSNGLICEFCHLCEAGERKRRRKEKIEVRKAAHRLRKTTRAV